MKVGSAVWPKLNREQLRPFPGAAFEEMARDVTSSLNLHLQASPQQGPQGLALRGFYVQNKQRLIKRPIVYVNTAHHPGAISATFCHEIGHHLTTAMFKPQRDEVHLFFDADYTAHLNDPLELAADVVVSLAGYPEPVARNIFASPWNWGLVAKTGELSDEVFGDVRQHARKLFGLNFNTALPAGQKLNYLAGLVHFAKLRWALLAEYDL